MKFELESREEFEIVKGLETVKVPFDASTLSATTRTLATTDDLTSKISNTIEKSWAELKAIKDSNQLLPGQYYRITDYVATTNGNSNSRSSQHPFDIIVQAIDDHSFNEKAFAAIHLEDTYFANSKLEAWQVWYCFENNTSRFSWADTENGKGVIYRLIDEFNNDCPYDFKGIEFKRWFIGSLSSTDFTNSGSAETLGRLNVFIGKCFLPTDSNMVLKKTVSGSSTAFLTLFSNGNFEWLPTFIGNALDGSTYNVTIESAGKKLPDNVFRNGSTHHDIHIGSNSYGNTFAFNTAFNKIGSDCQNNIFFSSSTGNPCNYMDIGDGCSNIVFRQCPIIKIGIGCSNILAVLSYSFTIGNYCNGIRFGTESHGNVIGNECQDIIIGKSRLNDHDNTIGNGMTTVYIEGNGNTIGNSKDSGNIEIIGLYNSVGNHCQNIKFKGRNSSFGNNCTNINASASVENHSITFGNNCNNVKFGSNQIIEEVETFVPDGNFKNITIGSGITNVNIHCDNANLSSTPYQNVTFISGLHDRTIVDSAVGQEFHTTYYPDGSKFVPPFSSITVRAYD